MREIKFRAWYTREKKMYQVQEIRLLTTPMQLQVVGESCITYLGVGDNVELMQFTGLLDVNGKEIYEGDIIRTSNEQQCDYPIEEQYYGVVTYLDDSYHIVQAHDSYKPTLKNITIMSMEIVGNVYEHPELVGGGEA